MYVMPKRGEGRGWALDPPGGQGVGVGVGVGRAVSTSNILTCPSGC